MSKNGIASKTRKSFKKTAYSNHTKEVAPNLLGQDFAVSRPNTVGISDITYIKTKEGWLYATSVIDLFNARYIVHTYIKDYAC